MIDENCCESEVREPRKNEEKVYRHEIERLNRRIDDISKQITTLRVIVETLAKQSGVKIERYIGTTVITTI